MKLNPQVDPGYFLLHEGVIALAQIESNGIRIDTEYLRNEIDRVTRKIDRMRTRLREHEIGQKWRRKFGMKMNFESGDQLGSILFSKKSQGGLGYRAKVFTKSGAPGTDEASLSRLKIPFIKKYLLVKKYEKALSTYLKGIKRQIDSKGLLHPIFNLHTVLTYRSSSDSPNFQNMPTRNPIFGKMIRQAFIARDGHVLVENDFKGIEVGVAACYHKDPAMLSYIKDEAKDMHRDMAMEIYLLSKKLWALMKEMKQEKPVRHAAKNQFVFPEFYGDWWMSCGKCLWEEMDKREFMVGKITMRDHLAKVGITELGDTEPDEEGNYPEPEEGTFLRHIKDVEHNFWYKRFPVYTKWKKKWYQSYLKRGYFDTHTGFRIGGMMKKNQVINFPVQGSAFHCLLWSLIQIQKEIRRRKLRTKIVGQIHDSIIADVHIEELDEYLEICREVTTTRLRNHYKWINVPLVIECEICPEKGTWFDKREVKMSPNGSYANKEGTYFGTARDLIRFWNKEKQHANTSPRITPKISA